MSDLKHDVIAQRWAALIQERLDSGMTIKEWCLERNIKESQYYYWLKTLRKKELAAADQERQVSPFVELPDICREQEPAQGNTRSHYPKGGYSNRSHRIRFCGIHCKDHGGAVLCSMTRNSTAGSIWHMAIQTSVSG